MDNIKRIRRMFYDACDKGDINKLIEIYDANIITFDYINDGFLTTCYDGYFEIVEWLYNLGNVNIHQEEEKPLLFACRQGHFEIVKFLVSKGANINVISMDGETPFREAYISGNLEIVEWLKNEGVNTDDEDNCIFQMYCVNGDLENAKKIYEEKEINIQGIFENVLREVCVTGGKVEIFQWLTSEFKDKYDLLTNEHKGVIMSNACARGYFELAKAIYGRNGIDDKYSRSQGFVMSVEKGYGEIMKWLYTMGVDIRIFDDCSIKELYRLNKLEIAKWLFSLYDKTEKYEFAEYKEIEKLVKMEKEHYIDFLLVIHKNGMTKEILYEKNIFTMELPKYLFY